MLIKSLIHTKVETINGKKEVKPGDVFECQLSTYNGLKALYKKSFEFLPLYVVSKRKQEVKGVNYEKEQVQEVGLNDYQLLKNYYSKDFVFVDNLEGYKRYVKIKLQTSTEDKVKKTRTSTKK